MVRARKIPTGDPKMREGLLQDADVSELMGVVQEITEGELDRMDKEIWSTISVAKRYANQMLKDAIHGVGKINGGIDSHSKMKIGQDMIVSMMLHPTIRKAFLRAVIKNPIAGAKLMVAMMPKDINVEVTQQQGVILVPMRMENVEDWEKKAIASLSGESVIQGETLEPRVKSWDDLIAEGNTEGNR